MGFFIEVGPPADLEGLLFGKTIPSTILVSSIVPPNFLWTLISLKSTLNVSWLGKTLRTASTAKGDKISLFAATTFEDKEVFTHSIKLYLSVNFTSSCKATKFKPEKKKNKLNKIKINNLT